MKLVRTIVKIGVLVCLAALFLPGLFTPWREALYDLSDMECRRQIDSLNEMLKGGETDKKFTIGNNFVTTWLRRDFEKTMEGAEHVFFRASVSIYVPRESIQTLKLENVRIRLCDDEEWTYLACGECKTCTNDCWVVKYHKFRLPE